MSSNIGRDREESGRSGRLGIGIAGRVGDRRVSRDVETRARGEYETIGMTSEGALRS